MSVTIELNPIMLKHVRQIVQAMNKLSDELVLEFDSASIGFSATSTSRSMHFHVILPGRAMNGYTLTGPQSGIKVFIKPLLTALKPTTQATMTTHCTIARIPKYPDALCVTMICSRGVTKEFRLHYEEVTVDHPVDVKFSQCVFTCDGRHLVDMLNSLPRGEVNSKLTLAPYTTRVNLRTHMDNTAQGAIRREEMSLLDTMLSTDTTTFHSYALQTDVGPFTKTFEARGMRTVAEFAGQLATRITLHAGPGTTPVTLEGTGLEECPVQFSLMIAAFDSGPEALPHPPPQPHQEKTPLRHPQSISSFTGSGAKGNGVAAQVAPSVDTQTPNPRPPYLPPVPLLPAQDPWAIGLPDVVPRSRTPLSAIPQQPSRSEKRPRSQTGGVGAPPSLSHVSGSWVGHSEEVGDEEDQGYDEWAAGHRDQDNPYTTGDFAISMHAMHLVQGTGMRLSPFDDYAVGPSMED